MPFFQESERLNVNGGTFVDINGSNNVAINVVPDNRKGEGIKLLLASSVQREAMHDSDDRGDLGCHAGTREEYIRNITGWGSGEWQSEKRAFLMTGPAGAGKSAIARTCAYKLEEASNLGASFFFYRPSGWDDPKKFIPTIVYQLTRRYPAYCDCIDAVILHDPLVLGKAMDIQFKELLVKPLRKLSAEGHGVERDVVIVVDGLDECATVKAQLQIIDLITTSIHEKTTPFLWAFFSRPEPPITSAFSSKVATNVSWMLPLTLSADADSDIEAYLRGSFQVIRAKHNIPMNVTWPKEENIHRLVSQSAGLFVYPVTAIRYIDGLGEGRCGFEERMRVVLELDVKPTTENPFSALDQLYALIMRQIPEGVLPNTMSLLQFDHLYQISLRGGQYCSRWSSVHAYQFALGLSPAEFHVTISNLYSVLEVTSECGGPERFHFYHKSFTDFLLDPRRSKEYFIMSPSVHQLSLEMVVSTLGSVVDADCDNLHDAVCFTIQAFFLLVEGHDGKLEANILQQVSQVDWNFWYRMTSVPYYIVMREFMRRIPADWRDRIIRPYYAGILDILRQKLARLKRGPSEARIYVLGQGDKRCLLYWASDEIYETYEMNSFPGHSTLGGFDNDSDSM